jgi:hypothetical protein
MSGIALGYRRSSQRRAPRKSHPYRERDHGALHRCTGNLVRVHEELVAAEHNSPIILPGLGDGRTGALLAPSVEPECPQGRGRSAARWHTKR